MLRKIALFAITSGIAAKLLKRLKRRPTQR